MTTLSALTDLTTAATASTTPSLSWLAERADNADPSGWWAVDGWIAGTLIAVVTLACVVLFVAALVSILRSRSLTGGGKLLWAIAIVMFQMIGPLVWFFWGRRWQLSRETTPLSQETSSLSRETSPLS